MTDQTARDAEAKLRAPRTVAEAVALTLAFAVCFGLSFAITPLVAGLTFVPEHLRGYINSAPLGALPVLNTAFNGMLARARGGAGGPERTDLPSWFVTGAIAGACLVAWYWFAAFLGNFAASLAGLNGMFAAGVGADPAAVENAVEAAARLNATVLTLLAAILAGRMLNRFTRRGVLAALAFMSVIYLAVNYALAVYFNPAELQELVQDSMATAAGAAGMVVGFLLIPVSIFIMAGVGVLYSRIGRERSMGRLQNAARRLSDEERHQLTESILNRPTPG
ncbi:MAG: hypothetical protein NW200_00980 [Hyphomonadaceae bacterium]|nr:hypothetical protein [Hyphomonadaceae bacterium]